MQDLGDKLRLVVTAHRRIKVSGQLVEEIEEDVPKGNLMISLKYFQIFYDCDMSYQKRLSNFIYRFLKLKFKSQQKKAMQKSEEGSIDWSDKIPVKLQIQRMLTNKT